MIRHTHAPVSRTNETHQDTITLTKRHEVEGGLIEIDRTMGYVCVVVNMIKRHW